MILLQASMFLGFLFLPLPFVVFAHLCGLHGFLGTVIKNREKYTTYQLIGFGVAFLGLAYLASYAIPFWSMIFAPLGLFTLLSPVIALIVGILLLIGLLMIEALNIYQQFFRSLNLRFSIKYFMLSFIISIGVFIGTMGGLYWFSGDMKFD